MNIINRSVARTASAAILGMSVLVPFISFADTLPTLTATETQANVAAGANTQTMATTSSTANVAQVKATRTITVVSVPADAVTLTIGTCVVTFAAAATQNIDCSDNAAAVNTTTDANATAIASRLRSLTSVSDTGHGALTVGSTSAAASFTTTGTETTASVITASLSSGTSITLTTVNTTGVVPVAQVWAVTPATVEIGDVFTSVINGTTVSFTATAATVANVTTGLASAINASSEASNVTATNQSTRVDVTADVPGTAFTLTASATNRAAAAQTVTFTPANTRYADFTISLGGTSHLYAAEPGSTVKSVVEGLNALLTSNGFATCTENDLLVSCTALSAGTGFTYGSVVVDRGVVTTQNSHHGGGGGGSSSNSSSSSVTTSTASVQSMIDSLKAQIAALMAQAGGSTSAGTSVSAAFTRDLEVGSTGADVMSLQAYLNAHGAVVATTGAGSVGHETTTFGPATQAALVKFQAATGITPASGYFGPKTRAYVQAH